jgi:hypothetical protein
MSTVTRPDAESPRLHAGFAQCAIGVAAVADVYRATAVRAHVVHPTDASLKESGFASMVFVYAMTAAAVLGSQARPPGSNGTGTGR